MAKKLVFNCCRKMPVKQLQLTVCYIRLLTDFPSWAATEGSERSVAGWRTTCPSGVWEELQTTDVRLKWYAIV